VADDISTHRASKTTSLYPETTIKRAIAWRASRSCAINLSTHMACDNSFKQRNGEEKAKTACVAASPAANESRSVRRLASAWRYHH